MLTDNIKSTFKDAAQKLIGPAKRAFMANVTNDYFDGSSRKVESHLGWSRHTVHKGLKELETGFVCLDNYGYPLKAGHRYTTMVSSLYSCGRQGRACRPSL